jgi:ornithine cyclodeaminase/alanine dehydrogenase-like protein (mu-crystallin family)
LVKRGASPRDPAALSVFKSLGAGLEDLAIASLLYDRSKAVGGG